MGVVHCIHSITGIYTCIESARKGNSYSCLECSEPVHLREGDVKVKHFAHYPNSQSPCVLQTTSESGSSSEDNARQKQAKLMLKNCFDTQRDITFRTRCTGVDCEETHEVSHEVAKESWSKVLVDSVITNFSPEGSLTFQVECEWKCSDCFSIEKEQAKRFEENRKLAMKQAKIELQKFHFGKHNGRSFNYVMNQDPHYVKWLLDSEPTTWAAMADKQELRSYVSVWIQQQKNKKLLSR